jgi:iron complex transport system permease protein
VKTPLNPTLAATAVLAIACACLLGSTPLPLDRALAGLIGVGDSGDVIVMREIRLPRALAAFAVGSALGAAGAALQGLLRNPLAEPGVLGVSATASLGAVLALSLGLASASFAVPIAAIIGALAATALIALAATRTGSMVTLILVGVGVSSFAGALLALIMNFAPHPFTLADMVGWTMGSVANRSLADLAFTAPFLLAGLMILSAHRRGLSALALGEEAAAGLGVDLTRLRIAVVAGAGLATGASVALAGAIGFVGLVAPHVVRPFVGHDPARTMLPAALLGGVLIVIADIIVRLAPTTAELKLGVLAALLGAPVFIWIILRGGRADG